MPIHKYACKYSKNSKNKENITIAIITIKRKVILNFKIDNQIDNSHCVH